MNKNTIIAIVLGVLILVSVVQAFQLNSLKGKLSTGTVVSAKSGSAVNTASQNTAATSGSAPKQTASVPKSLENLPSMVGGC